MTTSTNQAPPPHRTQIPNIVDDLGLDPYERALYVHYKRVCGENQGAYCYEAVKTTAQKVKMSTGQVSEARKQLANRSLILVQDGRPVIVTVANIWEINTAFYKLEHRPDVDGWSIEQVKIWLCDMSTDVHTVNISSHNDIDTRSPDETILTEDDKSATNVHPMNVNSPDEHSLTDKDNMSSYVHPVKQRIDSSLESNPIQESPKERGGKPPAPSIQKSEPKFEQGQPEVQNPPPTAKAQRPNAIPGVTVFVEVTKRHVLNNTQMLEIDERVGRDPPALDRWRETVKAWQLAGNKINNVSGMLDWFKKGIPVYAQKEIKNGHYGSSQNNPVTDPAGQTGSLSRVSAQVSAALKHKSRGGRDPT